VKNYMYYVSAILLFVSCNENNSNNGINNFKYSHYDIQLKIDPDEQFISVTGNLKYLVGQDSLDVLSFNLHEQFIINSFSVNGDKSFELDTSSSKISWLPNAMKILYRAKKVFHKGDILNIAFSYEGKITKWPSWSANVIGPEWIEMGLYFPWYPNFYGPFTYRVTVDIEPDYNVFAIGNAMVNDNKWIFETNLLVDDFIICASKDLKVRKTEILHHSFQIVNCTLSDTIIDAIETDIKHFYQFYNQWFGKIEEHDMCLVVSKRDKGGGYSRKGGLFLGGISDTAYLINRTDYIRYFGHEIAHFWWNGAGSNWEDWLNESFAEYSAMMLIREIVSKEEFNSRLSKKRSEIINTPTIWGLDRNSSAAQLVLYSKGAVLLNELEEKIGNDRFLKLCQAWINKNINNTSDFLYLLKDREGMEIKEWFEQSLKTK
ncbi:M1 family aminopeptidase, partial [Bacteroidota bacterium]